MFFFKNWPPHFDNGFHQQKILNIRILFHLDRKGFCFCWWKPLRKLRRIKFLKNNLLPGNGNQGESNFEKLTLFRLMETDFRAFFLLVETIIEIRRNSVFKNIPARGSLFMVEETDFPASGNHFFFSIFQRLLSVFSVQQKNIFQRNPSFRLVEADFLASGNRFRLLRVFPLTGNLH